MAMVFRSAKNLENPKKIDENNKISLNTDIIEKYKLNSINKSRNRVPEEIHFNSKRIAFGSLTEKSSYFNINSCDNFSPGPGAYNLNNNLIKKSYNQFINSDKKQLDIAEDNLPVCFLSNQKRFKTDNFEISPGPGHYSSEKKLKRDDSKKLISKYRITYRKTFSPNRVVSIPYNYEERSNAEYAELMHENNKSKEKDKINSKDNMSKNDINHKIFSSKNNKENGLSNNSSQFESNNFLNSKNSTFPTISNSLSIINYNNNTNSCLDKYFHLEKTMKEVKLSNTNTYKYNYSYNKIHEKNGPNTIISRNTGPGPGQYSVSNIYDKKSKDEKFQNFGSSSVRDIFSSLNVKNYKNFFKERNLDNINDNMNNMNNIITINNKKSKISKSKSFTDKNKYKNLSKLKVFYKSKEDILKEKHIYEKKLSSNSPGPGAYEPENSKNAQIKKLNFENFGTLEKRFPISSSGANTPGPGKYLSLKFWGSKDKIKHNSFIPKNIIKENAKKIKILKENIFTKKLISEKNKSPSVGLYSPEKVNCINYDNQKLKDKRPIFDFYGFGSTIDRVKLLNNKKEEKVDQIYNLDYPEVKFGQQIAPFLFSTERKESENFIIKDNNEKIGPGSYKADSYFDWNKKSYNILYN